MKALILALALVTSVAHAADDPWITIATNDTSNWDVKRGSLEISKTKGGTVMALVIGRIYNPTTTRIV